jgi:hypothetical protein
MTAFRRKALFQETVICPALHVWDFRFDSFGAYLGFGAWDLEF